jgi:hypothetical protein
MSLKDEFDKSFAQPYNLDGFDAMVFRLMRKADKDNLTLLKVAFPRHYQIHDAWKRYGFQYTRDQLVLT